VSQVRVVDETPVPAGTVLEAARDFSARRADLWPDVHVEHLVILGLGDTWADVTEATRGLSGSCGSGCATTGRSQAL
jgi:hypothetical protein